MTEMTATPTTLKLDEIKVNSKFPMLKVLIVEDNSADSELVIRELQRAKLEVSAQSVQTPEEFKQQISTNPPDVVLADYNLGEWRGMEALEMLRREGLDIPLILVSGALGDVTAVECIKQGATDYVLKDSLARLPDFGPKSPARKATTGGAQTGASRAGQKSGGTGALQSGTGAVCLRGLA